MKKTNCLFFIFLFLLMTSGFLAAQTGEANELYIKAMTTPNPEQKAQLLKEFVTKFGGKGVEYENFAYANLCLLPYKGKTPKDTIDYGEKALALEGLDDHTKSQVLIQLSGIYSQLGQNLEKARSYAGQVIEIARANRDKESATTTVEQWNQFMGAGYFAQGQALEKAKNTKGAVDLYINSYNILKNPQIIARLKVIGKSLYDAKSYADAEKAFKFAAAVTKDYDSIAFYAKSLYRTGKKDEALAAFKEAYGKQKSGEMAYNIGIILAEKAKTNPAQAPEAIRSLLEASVLYPAQSQKAMSMAESLFFTTNKELRWNELVKEIAERSKKIEELTKVYNDKFGGKEEEDLSEAEKKEMKTLLAGIETEQKALEKLQADQNLAIAKFNKLLEETKQKLGIK